MAEERERPRSIEADVNEPLYMVFVDGDSDRVRYIVGDDDILSEARAAEIKDALSVIGAWDDLDWDELADSLDRIRHESKPTPFVEEDDA